ncbi:MAG: T9SS type A sorting domain-containing protein [Ferruginibacter sp.]
MKKPTTLIMLLVALLVSFHGFALPLLNSLPSAVATIYLDFDGYEVNCAYWNGGKSFTCNPSGMSDAQVTEVFNRVAEDYRPFDINITTEESKFVTAPLSSRIRIVITSSCSWYPGVGGLSFVGSFTWGDDTPAFVFSDRLGPRSAKMVAECCSHESGHAVGLSHQSRYDSTCNLTAMYNEGSGTGEASWAPIMGNSYYRNMSGWNNGPTPYGCATMQDNLSIITTQNGFGYRKDDYSDDIHDVPASLSFSGTSMAGIISTSTDKDAFTFTLTQNSLIHIDVKPFSVDENYQGANLDVKMSLYKTPGIFIKSFDPAATMAIVVDTLLPKGTYYLLIDGAGNSNVLDYGSLGSYSINASAIVASPIRSVSLTGTTEKNKHMLAWIIITDEPVTWITVESSSDGSHYAPLNTTSGAAGKFVYTPFQKNALYYRVKALTRSNQPVYSNTVLLQEANMQGKIFTVSTHNQNRVTVNAAQKYQYVLHSANGNTVAKGNGSEGFNQLDIGLLADGIYLLQLISNGHHHAERIIKHYCPR